MKEMTFIFIREAMGGKIIRLAVADILYLKSEGNYVQIACDREKNHLVHRSLRKFLQVLPKSKFCRIQRSYILNIDQIDHLDGSKVYLQNGEELEIGTSYRKAFLHLLRVQG